MLEDQYQLNQGQLPHKYPNLHKFQDSQDQHLLFELNQLQPLLLPLVSPNCNLDSVQFHKPTHVLYHKLQDQHNHHKLLDQHNHHKELDPYLSLPSVMDCHNNFKVNQDLNSSNPNNFKEGLNLQPLLHDHNNLKQDHHKVLQSDLHNKHSNKGQNNLGRQDLHQQDFKDDLLPLQQDFLYSIHHHLEELDFKLCENIEKHTLGNLKRLLYSCYYYSYYSIRLWMCINENMLVLLAIIFFMLSKKPRKPILANPSHPLQNSKKC